MNKQNTQFPLTPIDAIQQRDLAIHRMEGYNNFKYQYQLFKEGKYCKNHLSDYEYQYGVVDINPVDGSITLTMRDVRNILFSSLEDDNVFLVEVTIKS